MKMLTPMMLGVTAGSMVGRLAQRAFGQYDLPIPRAASHQLLIVPSNLDRFSSDWSLPLEDLRLWVCLSEVTTHAVLNVPHVRADDRPDASSCPATDLIRARSKIASVASISATLRAWRAAVRVRRSRGAARRGPIRRATALVPQLDALVALVVGVTDHVMDTVGADVLSSYGMLTEALRRRRVESDPSDGFVRRLLGLTLTREQVQRGADFVDGVVERAGPEGLARLWVSAASCRHRPRSTRPASGSPASTSDADRARQPEAARGAAGSARRREERPGGVTRDRGTAVSPLTVTWDRAAAARSAAAPAPHIGRSGGLAPCSRPCAAQAGFDRARHADPLEQGLGRLAVRARR